MSPEPLRLAGAASREQVERVRCVLRHGDRFLLAQHRTKRPENHGKWGLVGGRLKSRESPKAGLRRELREELALYVPELADVGDWRHRSEVYRVFGCEIGAAVSWFDTAELHAVAWLTYLEIAALARDGLLHKGFELAAVGEYRRRRTA